MGGPIGDVVGAHRGPIGGPIGDVVDKHILMV
jgi:hypothetical protein